MSWREGDESGGYEATKCGECGMDYYVHEGHVCSWRQYQKLPLSTKPLTGHPYTSADLYECMRDARKEPDLTILNASGVGISDLIGECNDALADYGELCKAQERGFRWGLFSGLVIGAAIISIIRTVIEIWGS